MVNELYNCPLHYEIVNPIDPKNEICELDWVGPAIFCNTVCMKRNATYFLYITLCYVTEKFSDGKVNAGLCYILRDEHPILVLPDSTIHLRNSVTVYWYVRTYVVSVLFCSFSLFSAPLTYVLGSHFVLDGLWKDTETGFLFVPLTAGLVMTGRFGMSHSLASAPSTGVPRVTWKSRC